MQIICQVDAIGVWTGVSRAIGDREGAPRSWVAATPPIPPTGKVARWTTGGWTFITNEAAEGLRQPAVAELERYANDARWAKLNAGVLFNGLPFPTDSDGRGFVNGAFNKAKEDPTTVKQWQVSKAPIAFATLNAETIIALALVFDTYVQSVFNKLGDVATGIRDGSITRYAEIDAAFAAVPQVFTS